MKPRPQALRNRAQLSKFTWRNQDPARAEPGDATGLAGAGGGVCGAVVIASREQYGSYGWRDRCRGLFQILVAA